MTVTTDSSSSSGGPQPRPSAAADGTRHELSDLHELSEPARRLLAAADDLFFRQGAVATTVREITAACGLTPGALYNHFSSKDELLYWLVMHRHRLLERAVDDALRTAGADATARLRAVVGVYVTVHLQADARRAARVANREYRGLTGGQLSEVVAIRRRLRDRVSAILADGLAAGAFTLVGGGDPAVLTVAAATILDMCVHAAEWLREDGPLDLSALRECYVGMALRLVGASEP